MKGKLVYIKPVCANSNGTYEYDFYFSETPEYVWGEDWDYFNPSICNDTTPEKSTYNDIRRVISPLPFKTIEEMSCFSMEYALCKAVAIGWIDIENLEDYPEHGRCVFHFGDSAPKVAQLLNDSGIEIEINKKED